MRLPRLTEPADSKLRNITLLLLPWSCFRNDNMTINSFIVPQVNGEGKADREERRKSLWSEFTITHFATIKWVTPPVCLGYCLRLSLWRQYFNLECRKGGCTMIRKGIVHKLAFYVCATVIGFLNMMPFFWMISTSLKARKALLVLPIQWIPESPSFEAYTRLFQLFPKEPLNSVFISITTTVIVVMSSMALTFSPRYHSKQKLRLLS